MPVRSHADSPLRDTRATGAEWQPPKLPQDHLPLKNIAHYNWGLCMTKFMTPILHVLDIVVGHRKIWVPIQLCQDFVELYLEEWDLCYACVISMCLMTWWDIPINNFVLTCAVSGIGRGRDESMRRGDGSQWIVAARPLCHLQCPVAYLSRLQRIQPTARWEGSFEAAYHGSSAGQA